MGRKIQLIRWALAPALVVCLTLAPEALAGGLTDTPTAGAGQLAASVSAVQASVVEDSLVVQNSAPETVEMAVATTPAAVTKAAAAVIEPARSEIAEVRVAAPRAALPVAVVDGVRQAVAAPPAQLRTCPTLRSFSAQSSHLPQRRLPSQSL